MVAHIQTVAFRGVDAVPIDVQVHLAPGQNAITIVGLPDKSVAESRERVRAALSAIGLALPYDRITINLSPADLPKEGSHYDLPIALARLPGLLPELSPQERLEISVIESLASQRGGVRLAARRPFRAPHHSASMAALIGGGRQARPGEISLAHGGVLFLDELPEFSRQALDALRQPIETGRAEVARAEAHVSYHARFQLVAAMNPCRCGHADDADLACHRLPLCRQEYLARLSGPLLDRFDIRIHVPPVPLSAMMAEADGEASRTVAARVAAAHRVQMARQNGLNARLDGDRLRRLAAPDAAAQKLLDAVVDEGRMTARGFNRVLRVARSLADLAGRDRPGEEDMATALMWRGLGRF